MGTAPARLLVSTAEPRPGRGQAAARFAVLAVALLAVGGALAQQPADWGTADAELLVDDLHMPANIDVAPDGGVWYAELSGDLSRWDPASNTTGTVYSVDVVTGGERGLVGMALAGDFNESGEYFLYYTAEGEDGEAENRLVRVSGQQQETLATVPAGMEHNGGRIQVVPDGTLYVGTGENKQQGPAQDPGNHLGAILHLHPDGTPAEDNIEGLVHTIGHRNVYGFAYDEDTQRLFATENNGWRRDEINLVEPGNNYGYPECSGYNESWTDQPCTEDNVTMPLATFYEDRAAAPTGAVVMDGDLYWASYNEGTIHRLTIEDLPARETTDEIVYEHEDAILDIAIGPDDQMYVSTTEALWRLDFTLDEQGQLTEQIPAAPGVLALVLAALTVSRTLWS